MNSSEPSSSSSSSSHREYSSNDQHLSANSDSPDINTDNSFYTAGNGNGSTMAGDILRPPHPVASARDVVDYYLTNVLYLFSTLFVLAELAARRLARPIEPWVERVRGRIHQHYIVAGTDPPPPADIPDLESGLGLQVEHDSRFEEEERFGSLSSPAASLSTSSPLPKTNSSTLSTETTPLLLSSPQNASRYLPSRRSSEASSHPSLVTIRARSDHPDENDSDERVPSSASADDNERTTEPKHDEGVDSDEYAYDRPISATSSTSSFLSPPPSYDSHPSSSSSSLIILRSALKKPSHPSTPLVASSNVSFVDTPSSILRKSVRFNERENQTRIVEYTLAEREEKRSGKQGGRWLSKDGKSRAWQDGRSSSSSPLRLSRRELDNLDTETEAALIFGDSWMGKLLHSAFVSLRASAQSSGSGPRGHNAAMMGFANDVPEDRSWRDAGAF